jgi:hypothetical protein
MGDRQMRHHVRELAFVGWRLGPPGGDGIGQLAKSGVGFRSQVEHVGEAPGLPQLQVESLMPSQ